MRTAKIQISLGIRAVWSESSLCGFKIATGAKIHHADDEDTNQPARPRRLFSVFIGRTRDNVRFLTKRLQYFLARAITVELAVGVLCLIYQFIFDSQDSTDFIKYVLTWMSFSIRQAW